MRKIPTLFLRDWDGDRRYVTQEINPECTWVIAGQGVPRRKYDGTCVMLDGDRWWARREVREGKPVPAGFIPLGTDPQTGKTMGWEPAEQSPFAKLHAEALRNQQASGTLAGFRPGTYELCGPKVNGNPEALTGHVLVPHGEADELADAPRDFDGLAKWLHERPYEGIVWHGGPDGAMAKIKKRDLREP